MDRLKLYPVFISGVQGNQPGTATKRRGRPWQTTLAHAHGKGHATCLCRPVAGGERKLSIKRVIATGQYHLARFPFTADEHSGQCLYSTHGTAPDGPEPAPPVAAVIKREDGLTLITFNASLRNPVQTGRQRGRRALPSAPPAAIRHRDRIGLMGLLATLWDAAELNTWRPAFEGRRNMAVAMTRLLRAAQSIHVNEMPLSQALLLQTGAGAEARSGRNAAVTAAAVAAGHRLFVLASLARHSPDKHLPAPRNLPVAGFFGMPWVSLDPSLWRDTLTRHPDALAAWVRGRPVVVVALVDPLSRPAAALSIALMPVCEGLIPVSSPTEYAYSKRLRSEGKGFTRVLHNTPGGPAFTGFVLDGS